MLPQLVSEPAIWTPEPTDGEQEWYLEREGGKFDSILGSCRLLLYLDADSSVNIEQLIDG